MVYVATVEMNIGNGPRPAGCRVPEAKVWPADVLRNHIERGLLRDVSSDEADEMYDAAREVLKTSALRQAEKKRTRLTKEVNEAVAACALSESAYEACMQAQADAEKALADLDKEVAKIEADEPPEISLNPGLSERRLAKKKAREKLEAEAKKEVEAKEAKDAERAAKKARKEKAREKRKARREKLDALSKEKLRALAKDKGVEDLPRNKADMVEHIALAIEAQETGSADG